MSSALVLATAIVAAVAILLGFLGFTSFRSGAKPLGLWTFAWTAHLASAAVVLVGMEHEGVRPAGVALGSIVAPLMVAGCYSRTDRALPAWLIPAASALAGARIVAAQLGAIGTRVVLHLPMEDPPSESLGAAQT